MTGETKHDQIHSRPEKRPPGRAADDDRGRGTGGRSVGAAGEPTEVKGKVAQSSQTPRGAVDGLILKDGTEVLRPPHLSTKLAFAVRPGAAVTVKGVKMVANPFVTAVSLTSDATGAVIDTRSPGPP